MSKAIVGLPILIQNTNTYTLSKHPWLRLAVNITACRFSNFSQLATTITTVDLDRRRAYPTALPPLKMC